MKGRSTLVDNVNIWQLQKVILIDIVLERLKYPCRQCEHKATKKGHLVQHKREIHEGVRYPCALCAYQSSRKTQSNKHMKKDHNVK